MVTDLCCTTFCPKPAASDFKSDRHICHIYLILGLSTWKLQIKATPSLYWQIGDSRINMTTRFNYLHKWDIRFTICSLRLSMTRHQWVLAAWLWIRGAPWLLPEALPWSKSIAWHVATSGTGKYKRNAIAKWLSPKTMWETPSLSTRVLLWWCFFVLPRKEKQHKFPSNTTDTASLLTILAERSCPRTIQNPNN